jgi:AmiR/NasT family two-component response regulator
MARRVTLITDTQESMLITESVLLKADCVVSARLSHDDNWPVNFNESEVVVIAVERCSQNLLGNIHRISNNHPRPIVLFVNSDDESSVNAAINAGVNAYVVDAFVGNRAARVRAIISAAISRFDAMSVLQRELDDTRARLREYESAESAEVLEVIQPEYIKDSIH